MRVDAVGRIIPSAFQLNSNNFVVGAFSGNPASTGQENTIMGYLSGTSMTSAHNNILLGSFAGSGTDGSNNLFMGRFSGASNSTGGNNIFMGLESGYYNTTGSDNVYIGNQVAAETGSTNNHSNVFIGDSAGYYGIGNDCVLLGSKTALSADASLSNSVAIGSGGIVNASNKIYLHTGDSQNGEITGDVNFTNPSDSRFKSFVSDDVPGMNLIMGLRPVNYKFDYKNYISHLTQLMPDSVREARMNGLEKRHSKL